MCTFAILKVNCGCVLDLFDDAYCRELSHISMLCQEEFMEQNISRSNARTGCDCQCMASSLSLFKLKSYHTRIGLTENVICFAGRMMKNLID